MVYESRKQAMAYIKESEIKLEVRAQRADS